MDESSVKQLRVMLRQVQEHLLTAHRLLGSVQESAGMVDIVYHPDVALPDLNYVMPRRNTAWVPSGYVEQGLQRLRERERAPAFQYLEGLFPAQFAETLVKTGLQPNGSRPIMVYRADGINGTAAPSTDVPLPDAVHVRAARTDRGTRLWRQVADEWELPLPGLVQVTPEDTSSVVDLIATSNRKPVGIVRLDVLPQAGTAWLVALATGDEAPKGLAEALVSASLRSAVRRGCRLVFAHPTAAEAQALLKNAGLSNVARLLRFIMPAADNEMNTDDDRLAQPVSTVH